MDYQAYVDAMQLVSNQVDAQQYDDALAGLRRLLDSDLLDADKAILCIIGEAEKQRLTHNVETLRAELEKR